MMEKTTSRHIQYPRSIRNLNMQIVECVLSIHTLSRVKISLIRSTWLTVLRSARAFKNRESVNEDHKRLDVLAYFDALAWHI